MISFLTLVLRFLPRVFLLFFLLSLRFALYLLTPLPLRGGTATVVGALYIVALSITTAFLSRFGSNKTPFFTLFTCVYFPQFHHFYKALQNQTVQ